MTSPENKNAETEEPKASGENEIHLKLYEIHDQVEIDVIQEAEARSERSVSVDQIFSDEQLLGPNDSVLESPEPPTDVQDGTNISAVEHLVPRAPIRLPMGASMRRKLERLDNQRQK